MSNVKTRICVIGAGPCGMSVLYQFAELNTGNDVEIVCYEKQTTWSGLWNYTWRTGTDEFGEPCHAGMYKYLWSNAPKECLEFPDYTFEDHFGKPMPSYLPRPVIKDYMEGRWKKNKNNKDLKQLVKFNTTVRFVQYNDTENNFTVVSTNLEENTSMTETFTHVVVAVGIFNAPNMPTFPGIESFEGRILHAHNFRDPKEFKGQRLLLIGASYSAEDIALQGLKFGAKQIICTWRTKPMGFKWPKGIEERPLVQKFETNEAFFKDGTSAEIDAIIFCTGYLYAFPFLEERLRINCRLSLYPDGLYKGSLWLAGGNHKLFYAGIQDQFFSFTMFEAQALWICKYILGKLPDQPKALSEMKQNIKKMVDRRNTLKDIHDGIDFQADFVAELCNDTGYPVKCADARKLFNAWINHKRENVATYRDRCYASIYTGTMAPELSCKWMKAFDDTIEAFTSC